MSSASIQALDEISEDMGLPAAKALGIPTYWSDALGCFVTIPTDDEE